MQVRFIRVNNCIKSLVVRVPHFFLFSGVLDGVYFVTGVFLLFSLRSVYNIFIAAI